MASLRFINRLCLRGFVALTLMLILFNEELVYYLKQLSWTQINCKHDNCTRILFIADPQLLGNTYDASFYSAFARFDADRYLKKTFQRSLLFTKPHIICFLGDLLDEGNIATLYDFNNYVNRFKNIYRTDSKIQTVHLPGDNDIGGENGEYISNTNLRKFEAEFMNEDIFDYDNHIRFFKINRMTLDYSNPDKDNNLNRLRIGLTHAPLLIGGGSLLRNVITDLDPHIIFSGHWHESRIFLHPSTTVINFYENIVRHFDLIKVKEEEHAYLEIMVPTASYRMGKTHIGIGYGVFENYELSYTVLWLPNRFVFLLTYVFWLIFATCGFIVFKMMTRCSFRVAKRNLNYDYNRVPSIP